MDRRACPGAKRISALEVAAWRALFSFATVNKAH